MQSQASIGLLILYARTVHDVEPMLNVSGYILCCIHLLAASIVQRLHESRYGVPYSEDTVYVR